MCTLAEEGEGRRQATLRAVGAVAPRLVGVHEADVQHRLPAHKAELARLRALVKDGVEVVVHAVQHPAVRLAKHSEAHRRLLQPLRQIHRRHDRAPPTSRQRNAGGKRTHSRQRCVQQDN
ncbi:uncharacterized protein Tco025E_06366 [Trypanosoma conorhini]|uniref:Uncharacterized protein n=1 Tax=Trypanosoma conorhini TaxID=83891 RepID=A0A422P5R5_9TRYP|nr:uncharacterized protein Tco025E_06366 [Trypanosoma conorhini]RNF13059.1 hypothetical protein Tco025E_06366 [Trypanosoma conorhini]